MNKPEATETVVVELNNDRFITVHCANEGLLDFIRAQDIWQYRHHVETTQNTPTHCYGRVSPLFEFENTVEWLRSLTVDSMPIEREPDASMYEEAEDGMTPDFFDALLAADMVSEAMVDALVATDESDGD